MPSSAVGGGWQGKEFLRYRARAGPEFIRRQLSLEQVPMKGIPKIDRAEIVGRQLRKVKSKLQLVTCGVGKDA
jgi:hypothetical protein